MIEIAKVLKPQGLNGELKLQPFSTDQNLWQKIAVVQIDGQPYEVQSVRTYKQFVFVRLKNVQNCTQAEEFRGKNLFADQNLISKSANEFLIAELVDSRVEDEHGKFFGVVESVEKYGSADIINILCGGARKSFPFLNQVVKFVDVQNKKIVVCEQKLLEVLI